MNFLRYVIGAQPIKRLKPTTPTPEEKKNSKKEYELKRKRKFQKQWFINRSWLKYDESKNEMYCTSCKQDKVESVFTKGTSNFKQHKNCKAHLLYLYMLDSINKPETSKASQCLLQLKKQEFENLQMKFRNTHASAKHHKPFRDYELLCQLHRRKGVDMST